MTDYCSVWSLNLSRCIPTLLADAWGSLPWYVPWVFWGIVVLVALWALGQVKNVAGTPGVIGVLGIAAYLIGYWRGENRKGIIPHNSAPAAPPAAPASKAAPLRPAAPRKPPSDPPKSLTE